VEIFIVNVYHLLLELNAKLVRLFFVTIHNYFFPFLLLNLKKIKIGGLDIGEQTILTNFYNSLTSNGSLNWNVGNDLCGQNGIVCDSSIPKRVTQLYIFLYFLFYFIFLSHLMKPIINKIK